MGYREGPGRSPPRGASRGSPRPCPFRRLRRCHAKNAPVGQYRYALDTRRVRGPFAAASGGPDRLGRARLAGPRGARPARVPFAVSGDVMPKTRPWGGTVTPATPGASGVVHPGERRSDRRGRGFVAGRARPVPRRSAGAAIELLRSDSLSYS
jgi:hypothetical protein